MPPKYRELLELDEGQTGEHPHHLCAHAPGGDKEVVGAEHPAGVPAQAVRQHAQEDEDGVGSQW